MFVAHIVGVFFHFVDVRARHNYFYLSRLMHTFLPSLSLSHKRNSIYTLDMVYSLPTSRQKEMYWQSRNRLGLCNCTILSRILSTCI